MTGKQVERKQVGDLDNSYSIVRDQQDTYALREYFGFPKDWDGFDTFFVQTADGDYTQVWGMEGIIPYLYKIVTRLV